MININSRQIDAEDAAALFAAVVEFVRNDEEECAYDVSIVRAGGYAATFARCIKAAAIVAAAHVEEGDEWDGVVWFELLEKTDADSLACKLITMPEDIEGTDEENDYIRTVTLAWLERIDGTIAIDSLDLDKFALGFEQ